MKSNASKESRISGEKKHLMKSLKFLQRKEGKKKDVSISSETDESSGTDTDASEGSWSVSTFESRSFVLNTDDSTIESYGSRGPKRRSRSRSVKGKYREGDDGTVFSGSINYQFDKYQPQPEDAVSSASSKIKMASRSLKKKNFEKYLKVQHTEARQLLKSGKFNKSLFIFHEITASLIEMYGDTNHRVGTAMHNIGVVHRRKNNLEGALEAMENAVSIRKASLGQEDSEVADSLVEVGIILLALSEFEDSLEAFNEALEIRDIQAAKAGDGDKTTHLLVAKILNNIGCVYFEYGDLRGARKTLLDALKIQEEMLGPIPGSEPGSLTMASTMCNIGYVHLEKKRYLDAIDIFNEALVIQTVALDEENAAVRNTLENLAFANAKNGTYDEAMKCYDTLLKAQKKALGDEHILVSLTLKKMTFIHVTLYQYEEAHEKLQLINRTEEKELYPDDINRFHTKAMLNRVVYHVLKFNTAVDTILIELTKCGMQNPFTGRTLDYTWLGTVSESIDIKPYEIEKPMNSSIKSGHNIAFA